ncbi:MAG: argininosuccinate lyase [Candidatus Pacebacteria bacterium]|nr:argininosuccinate lyase [Candidatus Paceibacterota bacterium]
MALWNGRFSRDTDALVAAYTASVDYDKRLYPYDIACSIAHAEMLGEAGIIESADACMIVDELQAIRQEIDEWTFEWRQDLEDVHMNIEATLIERLGDAGARLHTGRSRNDQIATDERLYLRDQVELIQKLLRQTQKALVNLGVAHSTAILPGLTHFQHAQPVLFAHHLLAYVEMFERDVSRLEDCRRRFNVLPLGAGALAGSTLPLNRELVARKLGFDGVTANSMDAVADRDYLVEFLAALALVAMHCSRLAEDTVVWMSQEFGFIELDDAFCTGSSLMPQKKNPDIAELTRGKTGRVYGALMGMLTILKGLPLTYNRDLQEDKEGLFDAIDTVAGTLAVLAPMFATAWIHSDAMEEAASDPALMATDLAEWLVRGGVPFREAHHQVGRFVAWCRERDMALNDATLGQMRETIPAAQPECLDLFSPRKSVAARELYGGTGPDRVDQQLTTWQEKLKHVESRSSST